MKKTTRNAVVTQVCPAIATLALFLTATHPAAAATDTWTGTSGVNWSSPGNWTGGNAPPQSGDSLVFNTTSGSTTLNNDLTGLAAYGVTFTGTGFTLNGSGLLISGNTNANNIGFLNNSGGSPETIGMNLTVDWGYYTFTGNYGSPDGLALNGTLTLNPGGVAYFDPNVTSTSLGNDSSGLIAGLGGAGLTYPGSGTAFNGLATMNGTAIGTYSGWPSVVASAGTIGATTAASAQNIELTATTAGNYTLANGSGITYANTIFLANDSSAKLVVGSAAGAQTLDMGAVSGIGGFYLPAGSAVGELVVGSGASTILTAGPETGPATPGTIVFAINGGSSGSALFNECTNNSTITNNGSGGAVTVVKTGTGSMISGSTLTNTFTGGLYIDQGQFAAGGVNSLGNGPVYVAGGATLVTAVGGTITNNLYLTPGLGDTTGSGVITSPGALVWDTTVTYSGTITLMGAPATTGHGDRISGNDTGGSMTMTGQITGTGTLEIGGAHTVGAITLANTSTSNPNNWQGGLVIEANTGVAVNTYFKMGANNQLPNGANAGNVTLIPATSAVAARLDLNGFNATINGLIATSGGSEANLADFGTANSILTLGANDATASFSGLVSDSGAGKALSLVKIGAGTQTFTGTLNHFGNTTVSNGLFELQTTIASSSNIIVAATGTLDASQGPNGGLTVGVKQTLTGTGTVNGSTTINGTIAPGILAVSGATTNLGTLTNGGSVTLNGGATNFWYVNNANGTAGAASGWGLLNVIGNGTLTINNASITSPIRVKLVSLTATGAPGNATFNPNINQSWILVQTTQPIAGYTSPQQFFIDTSGFANLPSGSSQFTVTTDQTGNNLILVFSSTPVITTPLVNQTNNAGTTAIFTVTAAGATPITYQWIQQGTMVLANGGNSASGGLVTIATNGAGTVSTLTIANVEDADDGAITVDVTNNAAGVGTSTAELSVIDPPTNPNINQSGASSSTDPFAGGIEYLSVTVNGTPPYSYFWSYNGNVISGATGSSIGVDLSPTTAGNYTVVVSNAAGFVTANPFTVNPVTVVPNQLIYENFDSYGQMSGPSAPYTWQGVTNVYNQATGEGAYWFHSSGSRTSMVITGNDFDGFTANGGLGYPWPGLAGNSAQCMYQDVSSSETDNDQLQFMKSNFSAGQSVYFSFLLNCQTPFTSGQSDCIAAFNVANQGGAGTSFNLKISTQIQPDNSYWLGLSKGNGNSGASQGVDADTMWQTGFQSGQDVLVVGCYQINSGLSTNTDDTVSAWFNPPSSSFGSAEAPTPTFGPSTFGVLNSSSIHTFAIHGVEEPSFRWYSDLRIGTTWASVTPISAPNLTLYNETLGATVVFASQNAGNPVTGGYEWTFNNGSGPVPLSDSPPALPDGATIAGSSTSALTISNATGAELGTYTVTGSNTDPVTQNTLTGSASALLTSLPPALHIASSSPNVTLVWATNWDVGLEVTTNLNSPITWTPVTSAVTVVGTNDTVTVAPGSVTDQFFRLAP